MTYGVCAACTYAMFNITLILSYSKQLGKKYLVFHIREQLKLRQARTFETKKPGLVSIQTVWHLTSLLLKDCFRNSKSENTSR